MPSHNLDCCHHSVANTIGKRMTTTASASGPPGSPHYADQAEMWAAVEYVPQLWDWDEIAEEAETQQELRPAK